MTPVLANLSQPLKPPHSTQDSLWIVDDTADPVRIHRRGISAQTTDDRPWHEALADYFQSHPGVALVGAKRLTDNGHVYSMGEILLHPKGFHSIGRGTPAVSYRFPEEVDAIASGCFVVDREQYSKCGGLDHTMGDLAPIDLALKLRKASGRVLVVPEVACIDDWKPNPDQALIDRFTSNWHFDFRSPDLDVVRRRYAGTGLLWNARYWGIAMPFEKYDHRPAMHWKSYAQVEPYRNRADALIKMVVNLTPTAGRVLDIGCGDGLFTSLAAAHGLQATGIDPESAAIAQARQMCASLTPQPPHPPTFIEGSPMDGAGDGDGGGEPFDTIFMFDVIEHLPNPTAMLRTIADLLKPGGHAIIATPEIEFGKSSDPTYHITEYAMHELVDQVNAAPRMSVISTARITGIYRDIIAIARAGNTS